MRRLLLPGALALALALAVPSVAVAQIAEPANLDLVLAAVPADGSVVDPGSVIAYTMTFSNTGGADATGVEITDTIPAGTTFVSADRGATPDGTDTLSWLVDIPAGTQGALVVTVSVDDDVANGAVISNAAALDGVPSNEVSHRVRVRTGALSLTLTANPSDVSAGDVLTYTVVASADGNRDQTSAVVTDVLPAGLEYVPGSATCPSTCTATYDLAANRVTWALGTLAAGAAPRLTFQGKVGRIGTRKLLTNVALGSSAESTAVRSNQVTTILVAVLPTKIARPPAPAPTLANTGPGGTPLGALLAVALACIVAGGTLYGSARRVAPAYAGRHRTCRPPV